MKPIRTLSFLPALMLAAATLLFMNPVNAAVPDVSNPAVVEAFVDGVVKPNMEEAHSPSGVVMVMKDGDIVLAKGYGYIDVEERIPVDPYTSMFRPGSISKLFTWVSVMQLVEQGKLDLDTDINQYLKTFQIEDTWPGQPITLRDVMTHTPGFEDGGLGYLIIDDPSKIVPLAESLADHQPERVNPPGVHTSYSNYATSIAGLIVANVSGMDFNDYVQKNIFDKLGMKYSSFVEPLPADLDAHMAKAYRYNAAIDQYEEINYEIIANFGPAGAMATSAFDMSLFARAIFNGGEYKGQRILRAATLQQMQDEGFSHDPRVRGMGLGFIKRQFGSDGFDNFGHDGGTTVFLSHFGISKKEDLMVFSSFSGPGGGKTHTAFVKSFYDEFFPPDMSYVEPPADFSERAGRYAGSYNSWRGNFSRFESIMRGLGTTEVVALPDNTLKIGEDRYVEIDENLFRQVGGSPRIAFQENEAGEVDGFVIDGMGVMQMYRAPFYQTTAFTGKLIGLSLLIMLAVMLRLGYQWSTYRSLLGPEKSAHRASVIVAVLNLVFFALAGLSVSSGVQQLMYEIPAMLKLALFLTNFCVLAALYHLYQSVQVWRLNLLKSTWARVRYSIVTLAALALAWFYFYWNFTGFNF